MSSVVKLSKHESRKSAATSVYASNLLLRQGRPVLVLIAFWLAIYVAGMFSPALLDDADSVHAEAAREMITRHDWVTLHANGLRYLEKAPLMYWGVAGSYELFGIKEWSTRLPLALGVLGLLMATYWVGRDSYGETAGFYSALVLGTAVGPYLFTRFLIPDLLVALWLTLSFFFFLRSLREESPSRLTCWGLAVACALNVLTKGLIGLVFPLVVIVVFLTLTGNLRHLRKLRLGSSLLVFLAVAAPWHVLAAVRNPAQGPAPGFLWFYFVNEHFLRYLNKRVPRDYDTVPLLIFWGLLLVWLLPWSAFLPQALKKASIRLREWGSLRDESQRANLLNILWVAVVVGFFSFSTRQEYYMIPALPGLALMIGNWLQQEQDSPDPSPERNAGRVSSTLLLAVGAIVFTIGTAFALYSQTPGPNTDLADLLKKNPQEYALSFGHFFDLTPRAMGAFRGPLLGFSFCWLVGTSLNWYWRRRRRPAWGNLTLALMMVGLLACVHSALVTFSPILSSKPLAQAIRQHYRDGDVVVVDGEYESGSSLNFYLGAPLRILHEPSANLWFGARFPDAPHVFETQDSFRALWASSSRVFLWTDQDTPRELEGRKFYVLARSGGKSILMNRIPGS
jgi:4-amino-4-deoxy-L-arabinose transferase-like glycosyltransferase